MIAEILENSQMCFEWLKMIVSWKMINSVICGSAVQTRVFHLRLRQKNSGSGRKHVKIEI